MKYWLMKRSTGFLTRILAAVRNEVLYARVDIYLGAKKGKRKDSFVNE